MVLGLALYLLPVSFMDTEGVGRVSGVKVRLLGEMAIKYLWTQSSGVGAELESATTPGKEKENGWTRLPKRTRTERGEDGGKPWMR